MRLTTEVLTRKNEVKATSQLIAILRWVSKRLELQSDARTQDTPFRCLDEFPIAYIGAMSPEAINDSHCIDACSDYNQTL